MMDKYFLFLSEKFMIGLDRKEATRYDENRRSKIRNQVG